MAGMTKSSDPTDQRRLKATMPGMLGQPGVRGEAPFTLGRREHTNACWKAQLPLPRQLALPAMAGVAKISTMRQTFRDANHGLAN